MTAGRTARTIEPQPDANRTASRSVRRVMQLRRLNRVTRVRPFRGHGGQPTVLGAFFRRVIAIQRQCGRGLEIADVIRSSSTEGLDALPSRRTPVFLAGVGR